MIPPACMNARRFDTGAASCAPDPARPRVREMIGDYDGIGGVARSGTVRSAMGVPRVPDTTSSILSKEPGTNASFPVLVRGAFGAATLWLAKTVTSTLA